MHSPSVPNNGCNQPVTRVRKPCPWSGAWRTDLLSLKIAGSLTNLYSLYCSKSQDYHGHGVTAVKITITAKLPKSQDDHGWWSKVLHFCSQNCSKTAQSPQDANCEADCESCVIVQLTYTGLQLLLTISTVLINQKTGLKNIQWI